MRELDWNRIEEVFFEVLDRDSADRATWLEAQDLDPALVAEVMDMLAAHEDQEAPAIERRLLTDSESGTAVDPWLGEVLAGYLLEEFVGRGGMGRVYRGRRVDRSFDQVVAVKIMRSDLPSERLMQRFQLEQQVLAQLEHPNIAGLIDGGVSGGVPYLVMPFVEGTRIDDYCDRKRLPLSERVRLLREVCAAAEFAHRHLVVHRDLKPSNILVTPDGAVRLLDFGIAKLLVPDALDITALQTGEDAGPLTPFYAAPEQLLGKTVTTATDIYSLGVLAYRVLTGRSPYRAATTNRRALEDAVITEAPLSPREALRSRGGGHEVDGASVDAIADARQSSVARLQRQLGGDLSRVLLRAMHKEPGRRYATAREFGEDLERALSGMPVQARPDSLAYRSARFFQRHPVGTSIATVAAALLIGFGSFAALQSSLLAKERDRLALETERSERVVDMLADMFRQGEANVTQSDSIDVAAFLQRAEEQIEQAANEPELQARLLSTVGRIHLSRGQAAEARRRYERAWELEGQPEGSEVERHVELFHSLALATWHAGDRELGAERLARSLAWRRSVYEEPHLHIAEALHALAMTKPPAESLALQEESLAMNRRLGPMAGVRIASNLNDLAVLYSRLGEPDKARALLEETAAIMERERGPNHPSTLAVLLNVSSLTPDPVERAERLRDVRTRAVEIYGESGLRVARIDNNLGTAYALSGDLEKADDAYRRAHRLFEEAVGSAHRESGNAARNLARILQLEGRLADSLKMFGQALEADHQPLQRSDIEGQMAVVLAYRGQLEEALALAQSALRRASSVDLPDGATPLVVSLNRLRLGQVQLAADQVAAATLNLAAAREGLVEAPPTRSRHAAEATVALGRAYLFQGRRGEARDLLIDGLARMEIEPLGDPVELAAGRKALEGLDS